MRRGRGAGARPNIVLILTDDEDVASHAYMPKTRALLEDRGTTFDNFFVTYSFCCPSRATILRGQYPHNTQIQGIQPPVGGFAKFRNLGHQSSTIATWLDAAGYHTAYLGKYLNQYLPEQDGVPPGWDDWHVGSDNNSNYNYTLNENGRIVAYGEQRGGLSDRRAGAQVGPDHRAGRRRGRAALPLHRDLCAAQPVDLGAAPRRPVRGRRRCRGRPRSTSRTSATSPRSCAICRR